MILFSPVCVEVLHTGISCESCVYSVSKCLAKVKMENISQSNVANYCIVAGKCSTARKEPMTLKECCCSMGVAWGRYCDQCPKGGSGQ